MGKRTLFDAVKADLDKRNELGRSIYGKDLFHTDSNNFIKEAYEEALDLAIYLKGALMRYNDMRVRQVQRYRQTPKGKVAVHRYNTSAKGQACVRKYSKTGKGYIKQKRYWSSPERVERAKWQIKGYRTRDRIKNLL